jgi:hypothetical protein
MLPLSVASILVAVTMASPAPQPTLKTIVIVHSSQFCTALEKTVRPALAGLMQNDKIIERGHLGFVDAGNRAKYASVPNQSGDQIIGPPAYSQTPADTVIIENRQRTLARSLEENVETVEAILADKTRLDAVAATDEKAKLAAIELQLNAIVTKQRTAVNIISGQVEGSELVDLYNQFPSWGGADATHGVSPLAAMQAGHGGDWRFIYDVWQAAEETRVPFYDPYDLFAKGLADEQTLIATDESAASQSIIEAAGGCK